MKWKVRSIDNEVAILDIETKRVNLTFEIGVHYAMLIEKSDPELQDLVNKKLTPGNLLLELSKCGIHLMPVDEDAKVGGIPLKDKAAEERAIIDIATGLRSFAFRSSKWNKSISADNIVIKFRENLEFDREFFEDHEPDWKYMMWWFNKCAYVKCSDDEDQADISIVQGHETHSIMALALKDTVQEEAIDRCIQYSYIEFIDTVKKMLRLTRVLAFT